MKFAINTATHFGNAIISLLDDAGYDGANGAIFYGEDAYVLVNTNKRTYKDAATSADRITYNPATDWATIAALVTSQSGGAQATAAAISVAPKDMEGKDISVGDRVIASNGAKTKPQFQLNNDTVYVVTHLTASGKVGLNNSTGHEYLPSRFVVVSNANLMPTVAPVITPVAAVEAVDIAGNVLRVGDTVLVKVPVGKRSKNPAAPANLFNLRPNGVATITRITAKGALGFDFDQENEFLAKRFQKVTLAPVRVDSQGACITSGTLLVAAPRRDGRFALPTNTALTFRGVTVSKGNFILDGYDTDQYSPKRFSVVTPVVPA
jgi:hypothetical protein